MVEKIICPMQLTCEDFTAGHKRRSHHVRMTEDCIRLKDKTCPMIGSACNIKKVKEIKDILKEVREL